MLLRRSSPARRHDARATTRVEAAVLTVAWLLIAACSSTPPVPPGSSSPGPSVIVPSPQGSGATSSPDATGTSPLPATPSPTGSAPTSTLTRSPTPTLTPTPTPRPELTTVTSDDGLLALDLVPGSWLLGVTVAARARGRADLPPELAGLEVRSAFYALEPAGLIFDQPVVVRRALSMSALGFDPAESGVPVVLQAVRESDGTWGWLADQEFDWDGGDAVRMSGRLTRFSDLFGFGGTAFLEVVAVGPVGAVPVDEAFTLTITLRYDAGLERERRPAFAGPVRPYASVDGAITFGDIDLTPAGATRPAILELPVICQHPGEVAIGAAFGVTRMGAAAELLGELGLPETTISVSAGTSITCLAP